MNFRKYLDDLAFKDRLGMVVFNDLIEVWRIIFPILDKLPSEQIERLVFLTHDALRLYWGDTASMSLVGTKLLIKSDERYLEKELASGEEKG